MTDDELRSERPSGDPGALARLHRWGGDALQRQMVDLFLSRAPEQIADLQDASARGDAGTVSQIAHALKSSAGQLGAVSMQRLCEEAERRAEGGEAASLGPLLRTLETELARYRVWLYEPGGGGLFPA